MADSRWPSSASPPLAAANGLSSRDAAGPSVESVSLLEGSGPGGGGGAAAVHRALDDVAFGNYQRMLFCVCGACWSADGILLLSLPLCMPELEDAGIAVGATRQAALLSAVGLGSACGAAAFGSAADRLGRKTALAATQFMAVVCSVGAHAAGSFEALLAMRCVRGRARRSVRG